MTRFNFLFKYILLFIIAGSVYLEKSGNPVVIDADTLAIQKSRYRLAGIDAPELSQKCKCNGKQILCGKQAKSKLQAYIKDKIVTCEQGRRDIYGRFLGDCFITTNNDKTSISLWLIKNGYAMTYRKTTTEFLEAQSTAIRQKKGFWACEVFENPADFRKRQKKR